MRRQGLFKVNSSFPRKNVTPYLILGGNPERLCSQRTLDSCFRRNDDLMVRGCHGDFEKALVRGSAVLRYAPALV